MQKLIFIILVAASLTSCASMNSSFDCPMKPGISCESLDKVNARVDRGEIGHDEVPCQSCEKKSGCTNCSIEPTIYKNTGLKIHKEGEPLRYSESVMRVWIAPFEDKSGNYHKESEVFTIVKPGHWIDYPVRAVSDGEE